MKRMKKLLALTALILSASLLSAFTPLQSAQDAVDTLLGKGERVNFNSPYTEMESMNEELKKYSVFLTGELHGTKMNYKMQRYYLKYFVEQHNVRYLLLEIGFAEGELLNRYLSTGNDKLLREIIGELYGSLAYNQDTYQYYKNVYLMNEKLPKEKKIRIVGIDAENQRPIAARYVKTIVPKGNAPEAIADMVAKLRKAEKYINYNGDRAFCESLAQSIKDHQKDYEAFFGDNYFYLAMLSKNLLETTTNLTQREAAIISNFNTLSLHLPKGKYYGQLGMAHIAKGKVRYDDGGGKLIETFADSINKHHPQHKGRVFSMPYFYNNCYARAANGSEVLAETLHIDDLVGQSASAIFVNKKKMPELYEYLERVGGLPTPRLGDSLVVISNSPPTTPFVANS